MVFAETLRMYPILPFLNRSCVKDYQIPGTNNVIEKGVPVYISVLSIHRDEQFYNEPNKFDPERFNKDVSNGREKGTYLPFGAGPHNCIGMNMGLLQTKVAIVLMLQKHKFELEDGLKQRGIKFHPKSFFITTHGGVRMHVFKR